MNVHIIVDYMFLYYKYKALIDYGKLKRLTTNIDVSCNTAGIDNSEFDVSMIFYTLKEIEGFRRIAEENGHNVTLSVCFDSPSPERKEDDNNYKSNRKPNRLGECDFNYISIVKELLIKAGHNIYCKEFIEADDLIYTTVNTYKDNYDFTVIYTPDTDILLNINDNVGVQRYKAKKGYTAVSKHNYNKYCINEFNSDIKYNSILLYKCTCGDKSDNVIGIRGFGPAKFNSLVASLNGKVNWEELGNADNVRALIENCNFFTDSQRVEAIQSLKLVSPRLIEGLQFPINKSTKELRTKAYMEFGMKSLV